MKIFELLNQTARQKVNDPQYDTANGNQANTATNGNQTQPDQAAANADPNAVDQNLDDIATQVGDENTQPEPPGGTPQPQPPELDDNNVKPLDNALLSQIKNLPYTTKYDYDDNSPLNPINIAQMQIEDLSSLRNQVLFKIQAVTLKSQFGLQDNRMIQYCNDLLHFVDTVMRFKKQNTSSQLKQFRNAPSYQTTNSSKA